MKNNVYLTNISCHTYTEQKSTFLCSSNHHNDKNLYSPANAFDISAAAIVAVLSPLAVVKNRLILATIWERNFARTSFHIFLGRLAMTAFLGDLIAICPQFMKLCFFCHHYYRYDFDVL